MYSKIKFIALLFLTVSCYKESDYVYTKNDVFDSIRFKIIVPQRKLIANGKDTIRIKYSIPIEANPDGIIVSTSNGKFLESNNDSIKLKFIHINEIDRKKFRVVTLKASAVNKDCIIKTHYLGYVEEDTIKTKKAYPKKIKGEANKYYVYNSIQEINIKAMVMDAFGGLASSGAQVKFMHSPNIGVYRNEVMTSNHLGLSENKFALLDTTYLGDLELFLITKDSLDKAITDTVTIKIID